MDENVCECGYFTLDGYPKTCMKCGGEIPHIVQPTATKDYTELAEAIQNQVIESGLMHAECSESKEHGCVVVWSSGAVEQISARIDEFMKE